MITLLSTLIVRDAFRTGRFPAFRELVGHWLPATRPRDKERSLGFIPKFSEKGSG